jgi:adenine phosphoribosyltransferase
VFAYGDLAGARVLLIDDEVTTGRTLASLATVLRDAGARVAGAACLIEDSAGSPRSLLESLGVPLCALTRI